MEKKKAITMATKLYAYFEERIKEKRLAKKENTADMYRAATNWLKKYMKEKELLLGMVTQHFVGGFEAYLKIQNLKPNSVNAYLSNFRAMYNSAARECKRKINENPFANVKIKPHETVKRALPHETMEKIAGLKLKDKPELELAADLSLFCFMACGMTFVDAVHLKAENIQGDEIIYNRQKTGVEIRIGLTQGMIVLLDKYKDDKNPYLFPVLKEKTVKHGTYKALLRTQNGSLDEIRKLIGLETKLTTYNIRHTWATEALLNGVPVAVIVQALGHTSEKTTRIYLAKLDQTIMNNANKLIIKSVEELLLMSA